MSWLHAAIILPFVTATGIAFCRKVRLPFHAGWLVVPVPLLLFIYFLLKIPHVRAGGTLEASVPWIPSLGIRFGVYVDGLGLLFALLISGIGTLVALYSVFYMDKRKEALIPFYAYLLLFMGAMLGVVLSDNVIVLYGFWEITSISSFLLIAFWHHRERSRYGAMKSLLITIFGGLALLAGFILLYLMTGTFSIREMVGSVGAIADHDLFLPAMLLLLLGAFTKSAQFPFHIWLPDAMEAPTPVSAYLHSATMVKAGLYLVARFSPMFAGDAGWFWLVTAGGMITLLYGSFRAMKQTDLKSLLAFSTISQLGLIMSLLGAGSAAAFFTGTGDAVLYTKATLAAIFHLINHALFKGALFMVVGIVDHKTGTRDLHKLGGLMVVMPITFSIALIGAFSMAGLPPFNGFLSKEIFYTAMLTIMKLDVMSLPSIGIVFPVLAWIASVFTFGYSMILLFRTFAGKQSFDKLDKKPQEAPAGLLLSPLILAALSVVFGLFPNLLAYTLIEPAMSAIHPHLLRPDERFLVSISMWHGWTPELLMTIGVALTGTLVYFAHRRLRVLREPLLGRVSLNNAYDGGLLLLHEGSRRWTNRYMTGSIRHYLIYVFVFFLAATGWALLRAGAVPVDFAHYAPVSMYELAVNIALVLSALAIPFVNSRLMAIILTGAAGYIVTLFYVIFRAPDLALTQMIVETVSVALFLLCFYHMPQLNKEKVKPRIKLVNGLIAAGVGVMMTLVALNVSGNRLYDSISEYYLKSSYALAGGKNVVNVILVDFRGFDTMLEIVVLGIASFGIYAMIRLRLRSEESVPASAVTPGGGRLQARPSKSNDVILRTMSKVAVFVILTFALYLFFAGHNQPGGGFIGALMTAAGLILMTMTFGMKTVREVMSFDFKRVTAAGLSIALLTGAGSLLLGYPFLSHAFGYYDLPLLGETELATAVLFDLGVYLTVVGVTMTILLEIGRDK